MRIAAMILGILGGLTGLVAATFALSLGGINSAVGGTADTTSTMSGLGAAAFAFSVLALVGAGLAMAKPRLSALLLLIAGLGTLISVSWFAIFPTPLELIASLLAFLGRGRRGVPVIATVPASSDQVVQ
jgi:hypothetical protein